jgi:hypothetical protein
MQTAPLPAMTGAAEQSGESYGRSRPLPERLTGPSGEEKSSGNLGAHEKGKNPLSLKGRKD